MPEIRNCYIVLLEMLRRIFASQCVIFELCMLVFGGIGMSQRVVDVTAGADVE